MFPSIHTTHRPRPVRFLVSVSLWLLSLPFLLAQSPPAGFSNTKAQDGYSQPMGLVFSADGQRQFVWDKAGRVWVSVWNGTQYVKQTTPALDISDEVGNWRDFGLLSFCLDPNYTRNGLVYLFYVVDRHHLMNAGTTAYDRTKDEYFNATISRVTRYKFITTNNTLSADLTSRAVLLGETKSTGIPLTHESHAGGTLVFGRDGSLLLSTGDNASYTTTDKGSAPETYFQTAINDGIMTANQNVGAFRAQMLTSLCGKVLRLDPATGNGLTSNPFYDSANPRSAKSRVWTLGLRNPYRMTIQPETGSTNPADANPGTLLIGDVGWNVWEDMHIVRLPGENAGWPMFEGLEANSSYAAAALTLENKDEPNPNAGSPANTCNKPFLTFDDLLKQVTNPASGSTVVTNPCSNQPLPGLQRRYVHSRPALDWKHGADIARTPTFSGTVATATTLSETATSGLALGKPFRGNASTAGVYYAGAAFPAAWQRAYFFADYGANWIRVATLTNTGAVSQVREFMANGTTQGIVDIESNPLDGSLHYVNINTGEIMRISYGGNRPPVAVATASVTSGPSPLTVSFRGDASSDPDANSLTYRWDFGDGTTATVANPTHVFSSAVTKGFSVKLTVTDNLGLSDTKTLQISVNNTAPTARITNPVNNAKYVLDRESSYTLTAAVTDEAPASLTYAWQVSLRHNNHEHFEPVLTASSPVIKVSPVGCDGESYYYFISLKVTDAGGLTALDSVKIVPDCSSGQLSISGLTATSLVNSARLNWINPTVTFDNVLVVGKAGSGFTDRPTDLVYTADPSFTGNGAAFFGGKVLYQGISTSLVVTNLTPGTRYYFRVYTRRGSAWTGGVETSVVPAAPTSASIVISPNTCYQLISRVSGKVLGVDNGGLDNGSTVRQRTDANQPWQQWKFAATSGGYYQLIAQHSNKVLDVSGVSYDDYTPVHQWDYVGGNNQQWAIRRDAAGYYQLVARHSGKLLDVKGSNQTEGGEVIQLTANGTAAQQWSIEARTCVSTAPSFDPNKCYTITSRSSGKVLGVYNGLPSDGTVIRQYTYANHAWQQWKVQSVGGLYYKLIVGHTGKGIDVANASTQDNNPLVQWTYWGGAHQEWLITRNGSGYHTLTARHSGKAIDVKGSNTNEGGEVVQFTLNNGTNQQWGFAETTCLASNARSGNEQPVAMTNTLGESISDGFRLWPNPAQNYLLLDLQAAGAQPVTISLTDETGHILHQARVAISTGEPHRINTSGLKSGVYLINLNVPGLPATTLRALIQH
ncbi:RICIN domain-containing protein [Fibrella forsythiae]|uniref:RICIN domain-containing protein n=1 Tax=Fibrella forsythiae TaxID=2817061 RepID=A0ABS3JQ65_9BACT|nr:RICIN domain-containing protein [Fibrella forsythiae]MBO0952146.1 RICIN domain-containing protein [Fibrella forsythiae]